MTKQLALVVHGIGEQQAGQTVHELVGGLTGKSPLSVKSDLRLMQEPRPRAAKPGDNPTPVLFPCHIARVEHATGETVMAEVYWADLSGGHTGALRTAYDIVTLSLGLGHIARRSVEALHGERHWLTKLTKMVIHLLHGPVTACNAILLLSVALLLFTPLSFSPHLAVFTTAIVSVVAGLLIFRQLDDHHLVRIFASWLMGLGILLALIVLATKLGVIDSASGVSLLGYECTSANRCVVPWYATVLVFIVSFASILILAAVPIMLITQWFADPKGERGDSRSLFHVVSAFMVVMWLLIVSVIWTFVLRTFDVELGLYGFNVPIIIANTTQIGLLFAGLLALIVAVGIVAFKALAWRRSWFEGLASAEPPRLILNRLIRGTLAVVVIVLGLSMVATVTTYLGVYSMLDWLDQLADWLAPFALPAALLIATLYSANSDTVAGGVGVAKDVVTFFKRERIGQDWHHPQRERMTARFARVASVLIEAEQPDEIILVSHSLGTMIATNAILNDPTLAALKSNTDGQKPPTLVTMGCPYTHLFTQFFGAFFPEPDQLRPRLTHWLNIYRADDFVGTRVGTPGAMWPENRQVPPRGHTGYWADPDVVRLLVPAIFPFMGSTELDADKLPKAAVAAAGRR